MEQQIYNSFLQIILTQSSRRRREQSVITKFSISHMLFLIFILKINIKEESGFLITYNPLRPLRLCVKKFCNKVDVTKYLVKRGVK